MTVTCARHAEVHQLLRRGFYSIAFQPIYKLTNGSVFGFEALLRGPEGTLLAQPAKIFNSPRIDKALMHEIDTACILAAVRTGRDLARGHALFVNVHGETLFRFAKRMADLLELLDILQIPASRLVLEVSETTDKTHVRSIARSIEPLRKRGMRIALDDVGARYAWLHHMLWLQPEFLKIDRIFVSNLHRCAQKRKLIEAIAGMAQTMEASVIVEGVEREQERDVVESLGIEFGQGYLMGRPLPAQHWMKPHDAITIESRVAGLWE
jgi:EAL domain-containing protein (putative c-di-GMP-specific phosphodiesterase class I)